MMKKQIRMIKTSILFRIIRSSILVTFLINVHFFIEQGFVFDYDVFVSIIKYIPFLCVFSCVIIFLKSKL